MSDDLEQRLYRLVAGSNVLSNDSLCFNLVVEATEGFVSDEKERILNATHPLLIGNGMVHATRALEHYFRIGPTWAKGLIKRGILQASRRLDQGDISANALARFAYEQASRFPIQTTIEVLDFAIERVDDPKASARLLSLYNFVVQKQDYYRFRGDVLGLVNYLIKTSPNVREQRTDLVDRASGELHWQQQLLYEAIKRAHEDGLMEHEYSTLGDAFAHQRFWDSIYYSGKSLPDSYIGPETLAVDKIALSGESLRVELAIDTISVIRRFPRDFVAMFAKKQAVQNQRYEAQEALDEALQNEDYQQAARLRDRISEAERFLERFD